MSDYINKSKLIDHIESESREWGDEYDVLQILGDIEDMNSVDLEEVVHCKDCKWYVPPHILFNNGTKTYFGNEEDIEFVTADIGSNVGGQCIGHKTYCTAHDREDPEDYPEIVVFRETDDYCSYGERKEQEDG